MGGKGTNLSKQELDDILRFGTEELFKEDEGKEEAIHYDDKAVEELLDRSTRGVEEKENWANDYLSSFKVATYATKDQEEDDGIEREIIKQDDNSDPAYWVKLLRHHYEQHQEDVARTLGKGKRLRKQVNYTDNGIVTAEARDDNWQDDGSGYSDLSSDENGGDLDDDEIAARARNRDRARQERERPLPPLLAKVAGNIEVLGFNARQRKSFLNAIMRYGMPPQDCFSGQWLVRDLRAKTERQFKAYVALFMRHLCEPGADTSETFADGVPREGFSRQHVLTRIGVMSLIRKKVQEFEKINGCYSMPEIMNGPVLPVKIKKGATEEKPTVEAKQEDSKESEVKSEGKESQDDVKTEKSGENDKEIKDENVSDKKTDDNDVAKKETDVKPSKDGSEDDKIKPEVKEEVESDPLAVEKKEKSEVVISDDDDDVVLIDDDEKKNKPKESPAERKFMFNIADGGFTELHTLWLNEEKVAVPNRIYNIWHRRHDYWLLAGTVAHGYARWQDILTDQRFAIVNEPFKMDAGKGNFLEIRNKFLARRFKLLEQALVIEEQLRRAAFLNSSHKEILSDDNPLDFDPEASEPEVPQKSTSNNPTLHKVLNQLEELLTDMKSDVSRLPATLANIPPVAQRLQAAEKSILSRIATNPKNSTNAGKRIRTFYQTRSKFLLYSHRYAAFPRRLQRRNNSRFCYFGNSCKLLQFPP